MPLPRRPQTRFLAGSARLTGPDGGSVPGGSIGVMAHQALYRRYRPQRFSEVKGQEPVVRSLRNAAAEDRVSHAYLFSGPRGTGKTSTARILAKVLNCTNPAEGEPCGVCESCVAIEAGNSMDVHELDAASNNGVEAVRDLISRAAIGTPGRTKVYILDEVHMLSTAASNALLKTLEEPPGHVVFILATTDPQKVLPTIKSRTQHLQFNLLGADELAEHLSWVVGDAGLEVTDDALDQVLREGAGSARDTLSALDRVAAGGGVAEGTESVDALVDAVAERDTGAALLAVSAEVRRGRDPRLVGEGLLGRLRDVFLAAMGADLGHLPDADRAAVTAYAARMSAPAITRALELLGEALVDMRQAPDPRIPLEVALVRLTRADSDTSVAALAERLDRLERGGVVAAGPSVTAAASAAPAAAPAGGPESGGASPPPAPAAAPAPSATGGATPGPQPTGPESRVSEPPAAAAAPGSSPGDAARQLLAQAERSAGVGKPKAPPPAAGPSSPSAPRPALGARNQPPVEPAATAPAGPAAATAPPATPAPPTTSDAAAPATAAAGGSVPDLDTLRSVWEDSLLPQLAGAAKARFRGGRFASVDGATAVFALPNDMHRQRCDEYRAEVEGLLARHFGAPVPLRLVVDAEVVEAGLAEAAQPAPAAGDAAGAGAAGPSDEVEDEEQIDTSQLVDAVGHDQTAVERLAEAFGAVEVIDEEPT